MLTHYLPSDVSCQAFMNSFCEEYFSVYQPKGTCCPKQVQVWAFKMKIAVAISCYIGI
jgi:hypothetical protein